MQPRVRDRSFWTGWGQDLAIVTGLGVFLAVIGPYGSFLNGPFWQRLAFQLPCSWLAVAIIGAGVQLATARLSRGPRLWLAVAGIAALAMVSVTLLNITLAQLLWPFLSRVMTPAKWYGEAWSSQSRRASPSPIHPIVRPG